MHGLGGEGLSFLLVTYLLFPPYEILPSENNHLVNYPTTTPSKVDTGIFAICF